MPPSPMMTTFARSGNADISTSPRSVRGDVPGGPRDDQDSGLEAMRHRAGGQEVCVTEGLWLRQAGHGRKGEGGKSGERRQPRTSGRQGKGPAAPAGQPRLAVGFILARRFTLCAFANFVDVLRLAADEGDRSRPILCDWSILSETMDPVPSSCGVSVQPGDRLGDPSRFDYVVVVGGLLEEIPNLSPPTPRSCNGRPGRACLLVGLCTGSFILHRAGLMHGYRACVSWFSHADFLETVRRPGADL